MLSVSSFSVLSLAQHDCRLLNKILCTTIENVSSLLFNSLHTNVYCGVVHQTLWTADDLFPNTRLYVIIEGYHVTVMWTDGYTHGICVANCRSGLVVTRLPAAREDPGSRRAAGKSLFSQKSLHAIRSFGHGLHTYCSDQVDLAFHPPGDGK